VTGCQAGGRGGAEVFHVPASATAFVDSLTSPHCADPFHIVAALITDSGFVEYEHFRRFAWHRKHWEMMRAQLGNRPAERAGFIRKLGKRARHITAREYESFLRDLQMVPEDAQLL
jgi:hypothetical protein